MPLLLTKNHVPPLALNLVTRPRLYSSLNTILQPGKKLAVISAPAGFGKTTFLSQWIRSIPDTYRVGWYSLDENDNTLNRFFSYVIAALRSANPSIGTGFDELVEAHPDLKADDLISYTINQIAESSSNILLIIDDVHFITAPEIHLALENLIEHLPSNLSLILAGRVEPSLPLARWRARGQMIEIRTQDLRFNKEETGFFIQQSASLLSMEDAVIDALTRSTEGWAAGLQMTLLAFRSELQAQGGEAEKILDCLVRELSGSHRFILDYLIEEVLNREAPRIHEFLLRTCVLERFNAELCAAVYAQEADITETQIILEYLERANLFIYPLDSQRKWYRYHHLFADVLQKELLHVYPGLAPTLYRRAAEWFEQQEMFDEAISYAHRSGDRALLRSLVEKHTLDAILNGQISTAVRWLNGLPADVLETSPRLCLDRAWVLTFTSQTEAAIPFLERAEAALQEGAGHEKSVKAEAYGLQSFQKSIYGQTGEALRLARLALENSPIDDLFLQCSNRMFLAIALVRNGKLDEGLHEYHLIQSACRDGRGLAGLALLEADFLQFTAISLNSRNEAKLAIQLLKDAIHTFESASTGNRKAAALYLYVGLGKILYFGNRLDEAESTLKKGLQSDSLSLSLAAIDGWLTLWWVKIGQQDFPAARHILEDLESSVRNCDEKVTRLVALPAALQDLLEGKIASAVARMQNLGFTDDVDGALTQVSDSELMSWRANEYFVYARVLAALGKFQSSLRVLNRMAGAAKDFGMDWILYRTWITQATIYFQEGQIDTAMELMAKLLKKTSCLVYGAVQIYLSTGETARTLLLEAQQRGIQPEHVADLLNAFPPKARREPIPDSPETLSEREMEVLSLMAEGLKNQEIADRLVVSLNTVRYHSKNIYSKLGVDNRTAAVVRARELSLLE